MTFAEQVALLRRTIQRLLVRRIAKHSRLPFTQLAALRIVAGGEARTQAELADRLLIDAPAASRAVAKLTRDGLMLQKPGADRRCVRLAVTPAGKREVAVLERALAQLERDVRRHLGISEYRGAVLALDKLQNVLAAEASASAVLALDKLQNVLAAEASASRRPRQGGS